MARYAINSARFFKVALLIIGIGNPIAADASIDPTCLVSFDIEGDRSVRFHQQNFSCAELDSLRTSLFERLSGWEQDERRVLADINELERILTKASSASSDAQISVARDFIGSTIGTLGLVACVGSGGAMCALAAVGYVTSKWSLIDSSSDYSEKAAELGELEDRISAARSKLERSDIRRAVESASNSFGQLCEVVRTECLLRL